MSQSFPQVLMTPVYGVSHYIFATAHGMFFRGEVAGIENIPTTGGFLIAANHASHLDPPAIGSQVPRQIAFFARKTLWKGGRLSWWMDQAGCIPVDRDGAGSDVSAIKRVLRTLQDGRPLILFPEGTRSHDGELQTAKSGVGMIACRARVPVVPVRIFDSHLAWGRGRTIKPGVPVSIVFGQPMPITEIEDKSAGKERYQIASERIMARIASLPRPPVTVV
ncbi:lysophospholipid acyltransferase family protein [Synoicihabitans lomoniglobus]|uniref:Lysophospholipid acyltransferase family protein n=1 Tax=Synoicihabitans lomoniglobus TaxID=2909285 RepID=A0AAE9ZV07_9BACT|nr:1-acyl-sn-glycerol-3-phosphate acyltransferase [Opitutaceae bacterium LMO-M01]WED63295.1 lysophospholipid acyltransferase family protein [Opitutaceae bacterium LMO-M01]